MKVEVELAVDGQILEASFISFQFESVQLPQFIWNQKTTHLGDAGAGASPGPSSFHRLRVMLRAIRS